jgi:hypothetical protein
MNFCAGGWNGGVRRPGFQTGARGFRAAESLVAVRGRQPHRPDGRRTAPCLRAREIQGFERLDAECASLGHPSPRGAKRYVNAIIAQARAMGVFA